MGRSYCGVIDWSDGSVADMKDIVVTDKKISFDFRDKLDHHYTVILRPAGNHRWRGGWVNNTDQTKGDADTTMTPLPDGNVELKDGTWSQYGYNDGWKAELQQEDDE